MEQKYWRVYYIEFCDFYTSTIVKADNMFEAMETVRNGKFHATIVDKAEPAQMWEIAQYNVKVA